MDKNHSRILAIDPGYERLGLAVLEKIDNKIQIIFSECFKTSSKLDFTARALQIGIHVEEIIQKYKPTALSIENLFLSNNQKTAMRVAEIRGILIFINVKSGLEVFELNPLQIKLSVTGNGKSDKVAMEKMVRLLLPDLKNMGSKIDDEFDALACGLAYFALEKSL